jgi:hypothetical protein
VATATRVRARPETLRLEIFMRRGCTTPAVQAS